MLDLVEADTMLSTRNLLHINNIMCLNVPLMCSKGITGFFVLHTMVKDNLPVQRQYLFI